MRVVSIPVHPMTAQVLISEYGPGPIVMNNHDPLFTFLTCSPLRTRMQRGSDLLSKEVSFLVNDQLAMHLQSNDWQIGSALLKFHKQELCKFAAAAVMLGYKGGAKAALYVWLKERGVGEDDYSLETAYKLWQRFGWKIVAGKSTTFCGQTRGKAAAILTAKTSRVPKRIKCIQHNKMTLSEIEIELAAHRFTKLVLNCFRRYPRKLVGHARIYYYVIHTPMSERCVAKKLGLPYTTLQRALTSIRIKSEKNITLQRLLSAALPDTAPIPAPSVHDSRVARTRKDLRQDTRIAQAPGAHRSERSGVTA